MLYNPIILFTYKRLNVTRSVINSLLTNDEARNSVLIVYSDGHKNENDKLEVDEVRNYLLQLKGFKSIELIFRTKNLGLSKSFITGITETFERFESAIFLEDDNLVSPCFLAFMNSTLELYKENARVSCVTGYSLPLCPQQSRPYFVRGAETWSMGTWRRSWQNFCKDGELLKSQIKDKNLIKKFSRDGFGFYQMLQSQAIGENDSWGVLWWTSAFINEMYCLYPNMPLCVNIGYGEDAVHCKNYNPLLRNPTHLVHEIDLTKLPVKVQESIRTTISIILMNKFMLKIKSMLKQQL
jgi:hypothetical protein